MEKDAEFIKNNYNFEIPINGKITSRFGEREVLIKGMTLNHKGIDIATKGGTKIRASIDGQVEEASKNSQYGNFIKIRRLNLPLLCIGVFLAFLSFFITILTLFLYL